MVSSRRILFVAGTLAISASCFAASDLIDWLNEKIVKKISVSGTQSFGLHFHQVEGDRQTFNEQWYRGQGAKQFTDNRYVSVSGKNVLGLLNFDLQINNDPFSQPFDRRVSLNYDRKGIKADLGDINASLLNTNELVRFARTMQGAQIQAKLLNNRLTVKGLYSQTKAAARTVTIQGNNSSGPYYLNAGYVLDGTLRVQLDGVNQVLGTDYTVNTYGGSITFIDKIISPSSTILVSFETLGTNVSRGDVVGGSLSYLIAPGLSVGLTHIEQRPRGDNSLRETSEEFQGFGPTTSAYFLLQPPMPGLPVRITVNGILQIEGIDYRFDTRNPQVFYFLRFMPPDQTIRVTYTPQPDSGSFGNGKRVVSGLDLNWAIGKKGRFSANIAKSSLSTPLGETNGLAKSVNFSYNWGRLGFSTRWREIPGEYITVETTGFGRNDRGVDATLNYDAGRGLTFGLRGSSLEIGTPRFVNGGIETTKGTTRDLFFTSSWQKTKNEIFFFNAGSSDSSFAGAKNIINSVNGGYKLNAGRLTVEAIASGQNITAPGVNSSNQTVMIDSSILSERIQSSYQFSKSLNITSTVGLTQIESGDKNSQGHDFGFTAEWKPNEKLTNTLTLRDTFSGAITGIPGFNGGFGGYNGNGFSGGSLGLNINNATSRTKLAVLNTSWNPWSGFSLDATLVKSLSNGDNLSNSDLTSASLLAAWSPSSATRIGARIEQSKVKFTNQTSGASDSTLLNLSLEQSFGKRWRWSTDYLYSLSGSGGNGAFDRNLNSLQSVLTYQIAPKQRAILEYRQGNVGGYLPDKESYLGLGYSYEILPGIALRASYRIRDREALDALNANTSYKSRGFDLELEIAFGK